MRLFGGIAKRGLAAVFVCGLAADTALLMYCGTCDSRLAALPAGFLLVWVSLYDRRYFVIPPAACLIIAAMGAVRILWEPNLFWMNLSAGVLAGALMILPGLLLPAGSLGGGDIKLAAAAGFLLGVKSILIALLTAALLGGLYFLLRADRSRKAAFAFGPYLALGIWIGLLFGGDIWRLL